MTTTVDQGDINHTQLTYVPTPSLSFSLLIRVRFPLTQPACHLTDIGGAGLGILQDGTLSWWVGNDHYATQVALYSDNYVHVFVTSTPAVVTTWVNGQNVGSLPVTNPVPTGFTIGGPNATFDLASFSVYSRALTANEVQQTYVHTQLIAQQIGLPTRFWAGDYLLPTYNIATFGNGYQDVTFPTQKGYAPFTRTLTINNIAYTLPYFEVTTT